MGFDLQTLLHGDLSTLIQTIGLVGLFLMVFLESGMLIGFFFPGDSLLFTTGLLSAQGYYDIRLVVIGSFIAAVLGDSGGYYIGHKFGRKLFTRDQSLLFRKDHLIKAQEFYDKHGGKTIIIARFMPVVRAFAPVAAGIGEMKYSTFLFYNLVGALLWAVGISLAGYYLGNFPIVKEYFEVIIFGIIFLSILPLIYHVLKDKDSRHGLLKLLRLRR